MADEDCADARGAMGAFVQLQVQEAGAEITTQTEVENDSGEEKACSVISRLLDAENKKHGNGTKQAATLASNGM